jgi:hypothetical protein
VHGRTAVPGAQGAPEADRRDEEKHGKRVDYEYERHGTASIFMFAEPLSGFRQATARVRRTKADWAIAVAHMLDMR